MKLFRFILYFTPVALLASAASVYKVTLFEPAVIGTSALKPGDYRVVVNGGEATLTSKKLTVEVPVKVETGNEKFHYTAVESQTEGGKNMINDIRVGGTRTTLVFNR